MAGEMLCANCGYVVHVRTYTRGSIWIELLLWLCFLVPGLFYSIWRLTSRYVGCPACRSANVIPLGSPMARRILADAIPPPPTSPPVAEERKPIDPERVRKILLDSDAPPGVTSPPGG